MRAADGLVGRQVERASIDVLLDVLPGGGSALVFFGEAGIGKTALWQHAIEVARSRGIVVAATRAAQAESSLSYAGLADLLAGAGDEELGVLPDPQRASLEQALFRRLGGGSVDALAVALAAATVLHAMAVDRPLLIAVDDVQWLDDATATVLSFALRRLTSAPLGLVASERVGEPETQLDLQRTFPRLRQVAVEPLGVAETAELVAARLGRDVPAPAARAIHAATGGNPFFAVELVDALDPTGPLPGERGVVVPDGLRSLLARRLGNLSEEGRRAVVAVAASGHPTRDVIEAIEAEGLAEALAADIVRAAGARVYPRHPLVGTIAYEDAGRAGRAAAHRRLADVAPEEERPLHLALATAEPDEETAARLEEAAHAATERGAAREGGVLAVHALRVTPPDARAARLRRGVLACDLLLAAGKLAGAQAVGRDLLVEFPAGEEAVKVLVRLARASTDLAEAGRLFREALALASDKRTAAHVHVELASLVVIDEGFAAAATHYRAAAELAEGTDPARLAVALAGVANSEFFLGKGIDHDVVSRATRLEKLLDADLRIYARPTSALAQMLLWTDGFRAARPLLERMDGHALARGAEDERSGALLHLGELAYRAGEVDRTAVYAAELRRLSWELDLLQIGTARYLEALAAVANGDAAAARRLAHEGVEESARYGDEIFRIQCSWVLGFAELVAGDPEAAHEVLAPLPAALDRIGLVEMALAPALALDAEALAGLGRIEEAEALTKRLEQRARALGRNAGRAAGLRCRMLVAEARGQSDAANRYGKRALDLHDLVDEPFERARTLLLLGRVRRRAGQKRAARETLEQARDAFRQIGAVGWVDTAVAEIRRIGGRAVPATGLSEMERRIAILASEGRTNQEIAAAAVVSVKTVEANLTKAYRKLGVRSRTELARVVHEQT